MGWTRLLAHGVPVWDEDNEAFTPEAMLNEVRAMPGLKKAHFAMAPRWLKPVEAIDGLYSTMTFAISDPDGTITRTLLGGRAATFGKEVIIQRWVDKPLLVQCSHCHTLGHTKVSKACRLAKDSVKCYRCGGPHQSERHDQECNRKHAVAGICDCSHFKCINCLKTGHDCRNKRCPARDLFRPRSGHKPKRNKGKGRERETDVEEEPIAGPSNAGPTNTPIDEIMDPDDDLYHPAPLPPNPTRPQIRAGLHHQSIAAILNSDSHLMDTDNDDTSAGNDSEARAVRSLYAEQQPYGGTLVRNDWSEGLSGWNDEPAADALTNTGGPGPRTYSPSHPQWVATRRPMT
jgi:hypothetical protein